MVEMVLNTQCYQYLWLTLRFHANKIKRNTQKTKIAENFQAFQIKKQFILKYYPLGVLQYQLATGLAEGWSREIFPSPAFKTTVNTGTAFQTQIYTEF